MITICLQHKNSDPLLLFPSEIPPSNASTNNMPPKQRSPPHSRSLSPYSRSPSRNGGNLGSPIDVYRFDELINAPEDYDRIQTVLFG